MLQQQQAPGAPGMNKQQPMMNAAAMNQQSQLLNHHLNTQQGMPQMQMPHQMPQYDHLHQGMNLNGVNLQKPQDQVMYLSAHGQPQMGVMPPQNQFQRSAPTVCFCILEYKLK